MKYTFEQIYTYLKLKKAETLEALDRAYMCAFYACRTDEMERIKSRKVKIFQRLARKANRFIIDQEKDENHEV